jgi:hypothetical protein
VNRLAPTSPELGNRTGIAGLIVLLLCMASLAGTEVARAEHGQPLGAGHGIADSHNSPAQDGLDIDAPAFPLTGDPMDPSGRSSAFWVGVCDLENPTTAGDGTGTAPLDPPLIHCIDDGAGSAYYPPSAENPPYPLNTTWEPGEEPDWRLDTLDQAGTHPDVTVSFWLQRSSHPGTENSETSIFIQTDGDTKDVRVKLPPGLVGDPNAIPQCPAEAARFAPANCSPESQVGIASIALAEGGGITTQRVPVWNMEPRKGKLAEFMVSPNVNGTLSVNIPIVARARTDGDFGIDALAPNLPGGFPLISQTMTLWGVPWAESHDKFRAPRGFEREGSMEGIPATGLPDPDGNQPQPYRPEWGPLKPFMVNPTECDPVNPPRTVVELASWQFPEVFKPFESPLGDALTGCEKLPFAPSQELQTTTAAADSATGLTTSVDLPQNDDTPLPVPAADAGPGTIADYVSRAADHWKSDAGVATSHLKDTVVRLPDGLTLNPAGAAGLAGCSDAQVGLVQSGPPAVFNDVDPFDGAGVECPAGSKIGAAELYSPAIPLTAGLTPGQPNVTGDVVLGEPRSTDPQSGEMFRLFLVLRNPERGLVAKVAGSAVVDAATGQVTARFPETPQVPVENVTLRLRGGDRGMMATPQRCVSADWTATFTPWSAAHGAGGLPVADGGTIATTSNCGFGFAPAFAAGVSNRTGGGTGAFSFKLTREDGEQYLSGLTAKLPSGLVGSVGSVAKCTNAQAAAAACPLASRLGTVDAGAGAGTPFFLERKGSIYLTDGYKGAPFGLAAIIPVEAGPFRGQFALSTIVVRQALHVDRTDASVTAVSDPFPQIWHGIPLRMRQATVILDRPGFMRNPTDCSPKQITTTLTSAQGAVAERSVPFQASRCGKLAFKPKLSLALTGKRQTRTGGHPGVRAKVAQKRGQAAISRVEVRLPKSLALDPDNAQALCEYADGIKPEPTCPKGSIVGRAKAVSPLLSRPLRGNVFFVKNVRTNPKTGALIRTLPMLVVALRGEIAVNVRGEATTKRGKLISTFANVPDAPISSFNMNLAGGKRGILTVTRTRRARINLCTSRQSAEADIDAHNGRRYDRTIRVKTPCKTKKATRKRDRKRR